MRRLDLVVGPNGAGKSTFVAKTLARALPAAMIRSGHSFIAETVFSHASKLDLITDAQAAGFTVFLHVALVPVELSVARVAHRVEAGGHSVPEQKIRERHTRLWPLVAAAASRSDSAVFYDNSQHAGPRIVASIAHGAALGSVEWPLWADNTLTSRWPSTKDDGIDLS